MLGLELESQTGSKQSKIVPLQKNVKPQTSITGSIFMTVAIAFERYIAVHFPLDYNQVRQI